MTAGPRKTGPRPLWLGAVVLAVYATIQAARLLLRELARAADATGAALAPWWPVPVVLAAVVILGFVISTIGARRLDAARKAETAVTTSEPAPVAEPASCEFGPACPRCTGTGTVGNTAMDRPAAPVAAPAPAEAEPDYSMALLAETETRLGRPLDLGAIAKARKAAAKRRKAA